MRRVGKRIPATEIRRTDASTETEGEWPEPKSAKRETRMRCLPAQLIRRSAKWGHERTNSEDAPAREVRYPGRNTDRFRPNPRRRASRWQTRWSRCGVAKTPPPAQRDLP